MTHLHVPSLPSQVAARSGASLASMSTETLSQALLCELSVLVHHVKKGGADVKIGMGANH